MEKLSNEALPMKIQFLDDVSYVSLMIIEDWSTFIRLSPGLLVQSPVIQYICLDISCPEWESTQGWW